MSADDQQQSPDGSGAEAPDAEPAAGAPEASSSLKPGEETTAQLRMYRSVQLAPGTRLQNGRYTVISSLGGGGMGLVHKVRDLHFQDGIRALKEILPPLTPAVAAVDTATREAEILARLHHLGIPVIYDRFREFQRDYLVLQYIEGRDLELVLNQSNGPIEPNVVVEWMLQLCDVLRYLHAQTPPIIFRDLKPSNVILTPEGRIVLIDFGIARSYDAGHEQTNIGTKGYAAPEQYGGRAEPRSDIYAMGAMMYHLMTRNDPRLAPFAFKDRLPRSLNPNISQDLEVVIMRCLETALDDRYQNVDELAIALQDVFAAQPTAPARPGVVRSSLVKSVAASVGPKVVWTYKTGGQVRATPSLDHERVYIGSYDQRLHALDLRTGAPVWTFPTEGGICGEPCLWRDWVIFGSEDFNVYALAAADGAERWRYRTWNHVRSSPRVYDDRLYIGSDDGHLHALDLPGGTVRWRYRTYGEVQSAPAFFDDIVFVGSMDECLYAVDLAKGERRGMYRAQGGILSSPVVADGHVYFGSLDFGIYCLEAKSSWLAWHERTEKFVLAGPRIVGDRLYVGSTDGHLYCLNRRTGQRVWRFHAGDQLVSAVAHADGVIYAGCRNGVLYAVDAATGTQLWRFDAGDKIIGSPVAAGGRVYVGTTGGVVYALAVGA